MIVDRIILLLLGILSIRDIISKNFDIPKNKRWSWLFYNSKDIHNVPYCYQLSKINSNRTPISYKSNLLTQLILILGNHTKHFEEGVFCDRNGLIRVNYLVSTLEASHIKEELDVMTDFLEKMYYELCSEMNIDFIISLKGGNVILVEHLINLHKDNILHLTYNRNLLFESFGISNANKNDVLEGMSLKFENMDELIRLSKINKRKLNGIILDCSFSSGTGIVECVEDFNDIINNYGISNVNPIKEVRTLYSHIGWDLQTKLDRYGCRLDYLFSLNEEVREMLYELIHNQSDYYEKLSNTQIILSKMKKNNLLRKTEII